MSSWQILQSVEADFEKMTWTFAIGQNSEVTGGEFAVIPASEFRHHMDRLQHGEELLRELLKGEPPPIDSKFLERILRFFDPKPL